MVKCLNLRHLLLERLQLWFCCRLAFRESSCGLRELMLLWTLGNCDCTEASEESWLAIWLERLEILPGKAWALPWSWEILVVVWEMLVWAAEMLWLSSPWFFWVVLVAMSFLFWSKADWIRGSSCCWLWEMDWFNWLIWDCRLFAWFWSCWTWFPIVSRLVLSWSYCDCRAWRCELHPDLH